MAFNLIEAVGSQFMKKGLLQKISGSLGEDPQATTKVLPGAIAAVAAGVVDQGSNEAGAHRLLSKLNEGGFTGPDAPSRPEGAGEGLMDEEERGKGMLNGLFGNKLNGVADGLSRFGGLRNSGSAMKLLSLAAPMMMGVLGKQVRDQRMGASGLMQLLGSQRSNIAAVLPAGVGSILGFGGGARHAVAEVIEPHRETVTHVRETRETAPVREAIPRQTLNRPPEKKKGIAGWAIPLALLALVALAWGALRGRRNEPAQAPQVTRTTPAPRVEERVAQAPQPAAPTPRQEPVASPPAATPPAEPTPPATGGSGTEEPPATSQQPVEPTPPATGGSGTEEPPATPPEEPATGGSGTEGTGGAGMEKVRVSDAAGLREALESDAARSQGFVLEGVEFKTGSAQLTAKSQQMVGELGNVLKEEADARVRIKGFTDSTGNADANQRLSQTRADSVRQALVRDGVPENRIEASGEGDAEPIAPNDTPEGRVQNRRIEVQVLGQQ
ncbi:OmpA family protein [Corallococcus sp. BB11-1]|uniref:OmpA family protein n=1 Tax=Corallococcus sp. BB11-1 TaxID=2996783 RepID=UPI00226F8374|nr:OmpA family protein [Corallococcus sp. BB11-1]MCY1033856.1 OmpA family protein [Corallococcus sp. BB11-1]